MQCNMLSDLFALYNCHSAVNIMQGNESCLSVNIFPLPQEQHFFFNFVDIRKTAEQLLSHLRLPG